MTESVYAASTGAIAQEQRLELLTNNIANVNSAGYKADRPAFRAYMPGPETDAPAAGIGQASGLVSPRNYAVIFDGSRTDFSPGPLQHTGNSLDMAIIGDGFFSVETPDGTEYTRNGQFTRNADGILVTQDGFPVAGDGGEIQIEGAQILIATDGTVTVDGATVGQLALASFDDPQQLIKTGGSRFRAPDGVTPSTADESVSVRQGSIEQANVNAVQAMTEMIEVLRAYEAYQRIMRTSDETTIKVINEVGRPV